MNCTDERHPGAEEVAHAFRILYWAGQGLIEAEAAKFPAIARVLAMLIERGSRTKLDTVADAEAKGFGVKVPGVHVPVRPQPSDPNPFAPVAGAPVKVPTAQMFPREFMGERVCATCGKPDCKPMNHAGWNPNDEGHG